VPELQLLRHVAVAMALGALVGFERETAEKPAGLRTHMLVAGASALLVGLGEITLTQYENTASGLLRTDPIRIVEAVVTGVSFLGAGTIIHGKGGVHGLTTAASLLMTAGIGIAVALSQPVVAVGAALITVLTLRVVPAIWTRASGR
jgi:putative Mg2+ transporter-C (MgtC) family protein